MCWLAQFRTLNPDGILAPIRPNLHREEICIRSVLMTNTVATEAATTSTGDWPYAEFLTEEHQATRELVGKFAAEVIAPRAAEVDRNHRFPAETFKEMGRLDLLGMLVSTEYGGAGSDYRSYVVTLEEVGKACGSTGLSFMAHLSLGTMPIFMFGSEKQKKQY